MIDYLGESFTPVVYTALSRPTPGIAAAAATPTGGSLGMWLPPLSSSIYLLRICAINEEATFFLRIVERIRIQSCHWRVVFDPV
jgi:hypothetical protein